MDRIRYLNKRVTLFPHSPLSERGIASLMRGISAGRKKVIAGAAAAMTGRKRRIASPPPPSPRVKTAFVRGENEWGWIRAGKGGRGAARGGADKNRGAAEVRKEEYP